MGIRYLNKFLKENAKNSIKIAHLSELSGKSIAIDISIYLYKYISDNTLIENIYLMLTIFRHYDITPIFIFDGKAPPEKKELLIKRKKDKKEAEMEYNKIQNQLKSNAHEIDESEKQELIQTMDLLKKNFITISKNDIDTVKSLIKSYGATYYDATGEADEMCAILTVKNKVWACLSEDMDMFVYGCDRVIRYLSLLNHTVVVYNLKEILQEINISQEQLSEICILSGTDYNIRHDDDDNKKNNIYTNFKHFNKYKNENIYIDFYDWLIHKSLIKDVELFNKIKDLFNLNKSNIDTNIIDTICVANGTVEKKQLMDILKTDGFIFPINK
jgi:flap endonuclease-1